MIILDIAERVYDLSTDAGRDAFDAGVNAAQSETRTLATRRRRRNGTAPTPGITSAAARSATTWSTTTPATYTGLLIRCTAPRAMRPRLIRAAAVRMIDEAAADPDRSPSCGRSRPSGTRPG